MFVSDYQRIGHYNEFMQKQHRRAALVPDDITPQELAINLENPCLARLG